MANSPRDTLYFAKVPLFIGMILTRESKCAYFVHMKYVVHWIMTGVRPGLWPLDIILSLIRKKFIFTSAVITNHIGCWYGFFCSCWIILAWTLHVRVYCVRLWCLRCCSCQRSRRSITEAAKEFEIFTNRTISQSNCNRTSILLAELNAVDLSKILYWVLTYRRPLSRKFWLKWESSVVILSTDWYFSETN